MRTCMKKVGFIILFFLIALQAGAQDPAAVPMVGKTVSADKTEIVYTAQGSGKTAVIFIHGGFADRSFWSNQMEPFAKKYRVIALDLAGHGESGKNRTKWNLFTFAQDVRAVMEKEKIQRAVLVGNSLGGPVALETARLVPNNVVGIVAVDTFQSLSVQAPPDYFKKRAQAFRSDFAGAMRQMVRALVHADADPKLYAYVEKKMLNHSPEMAVAMLESFDTYNMTETVKKFQHPIRCINGDLYPTLVEQNRGIYPDFDAVIIPRTGHYPMLERPQLFNRYLEEILEKIN